MPQKDTEPFEQLISEEEVELSRRMREPGKRGKKKRNQRSDDESSYHRPEGPFRDYAPPLPNSPHGVPFVKRLFDLLITTSDPWRLCFGSTVIFLLVATSVGWGWLSIPGLSPFASAESVTEIRVEQLDEWIEGTKRAHCLAPTSDAKSYYWYKIQDLRNKYVRASKREADVPTCKDLGVPEVQPSEP